MLRRRVAVALVACVALAIVGSVAVGTGVATRAGAAKLPRVHLTKVASVTSGTALAFRAGDPTLYVAQQTGEVRAVRNGNVDPRPVLSLAGQVRSGGEQGLLGLTFSPDGARLYVHYSGTRGETVVEEYRVSTTSPAQVDISSRRTLLTVEQPQTNHNGGQLAFGPDGKLYLGLGDGGGAGDDEGPGHAPGGNGQSRDTLLGKILRLDPTPSAGTAYTIPADNPFAARGGRAEIWMYGLRNPWRFSFDTKTGDLWVADVGQNAWEEVDRLPPGGQAGANLGWNRLEGSHPLHAASAPGTVLPLVEQSHADGNCSITGGYVYRGSRITALRGWYLYTDYCKAGIRAVRARSGGAPRVHELGVGAPNVSSFGQDPAGELYVVSQSGGVFRIDAE